MKWFKHLSDSYSNLKHQQVLAEFGIEGYGFYWVCLELIAQQGKSFKIKSEKNWKKTLMYLTRSKEERIDALLDVFARVSLIDEKSLKHGDLYIPKMSEYADEYTDKVRRMSRQGRDKVRLDKITTDNQRLENNTFDLFWLEYPLKVGKKKAEQIWMKISPSQELFEKIMFALRAAKKSPQWTKDNGQFIPHPSTWLNQERWNDVQQVEKPSEVKKCVECHRTGQPSWVQGKNGLTCSECFSADPKAASETKSKLGEMKKEFGVIKN